LQLQRTGEIVFAVKRGWAGAGEKYEKQQGDEVEMWKKHISLSLKRAFRLRCNIVFFMRNNRFEFIV
jgi:hypothetical protein